MYSKDALPQEHEWNYVECEGGNVVDLRKQSFALELVGAHRLIEYSEAPWPVLH